MKIYNFSKKKFSAKKLSIFGAGGGLDHHLDPLSTG